MYARLLLAFAAICGFMAPSAPAAKGNRPKLGNGSISGMVVNGKGPVAGAKVQIKHSHHHQNHAARAANAAKPKKHHSSGTTTGAGGTFSMKAKMGTHTVAAHKKGVGSGHAKVLVAPRARVVIRLHQQHRQHGKKK